MSSKRHTQRKWEYEVSYRNIKKQKSGDYETMAKMFLAKSGTTLKSICGPSDLEILSQFLSRKYKFIVQDIQLQNNCP